MNLNLFPLILSIFFLTGCVANVKKFQHPEKIQTVPLLENVTYMDGKTFIKGNRYRILTLESGETGVVLDAAIIQDLFIAGQFTWGVEIDASGCTTGKRFNIAGRTEGYVSEPAMDKYTQLWTPKKFCFDLNKKE